MGEQGFLCFDVLGHSRSRADEDGRGRGPDRQFGERVAEGDWDSGNASYVTFLFPFLLSAPFLPPPIFPRSGEV